MESAGVYEALGLLLAPFYAAWTMVPSHPSLAQALNSPSLVERAPLVFFMELPIVTFDLLTGIMIMLIVKHFGSRRLALASFFLWYLNPYSLVIMELFGAFDILPAFFMMIAILMGLRQRWVRSGLLLAVSTILRFFSLFTLPFFILTALGPKTRRNLAWLLASFAFPFLILTLGGSWSMGSFTSLLNVAAGFVVRVQYLKDYFLGFPLGFSVPATFFSLLIQAYFVERYWKSPARVLVSGSLAGLLILTTVTYPQPYHFIWVIALLTTHCALSSRRFVSLFGLILVGSSLSFLGLNMPLIGLSSLSDPLAKTLQPLLDGFFYAFKIIYLVNLNLDEMHLESLGKTISTLASQRRSLVPASPARVAAFNEI